MPVPAQSFAVASTRIAISLGVGAALLFSAASAWCAESYKCQNNERVVRRDRGCLPGETLVEVTPPVDMRIKRNAPLSVAPPEPPAPPLTSKILSAAEAAASGAAAQAATTDGIAGTGAQGSRAALDVAPPLPAWRMLSWSDPPQKWLAGAGAFASYGGSCVMEMDAPACRDFRSLAVVGEIAIAMLALLLVLRRLLREHTAVARRKKLLEAETLLTDGAITHEQGWDSDAAIDASPARQPFAGIHQQAKPSTQA